MYLQCCKQKPKSYLWMKEKEQHTQSMIDKARIKPGLLYAQHTYVTSLVLRADCIRYE